jgi:uncharacterized metal-binding protein
MGKKVVILPCSGIGKSYGEVARQAVYETAEDLRPESVTTACLARLMIHDPDTGALVKENFVITIDGCAADCARKNVEASGKPVDRALRVIDVFKTHRDLKPQGVLELGEPGLQLAQIVAGALTGEVDSLMRKE